MCDCSLGPCVDQALQAITIRATMRVSSSMALKHDTRVPQVSGTPGTESQQQDQHGFTLSSFSPSAQKGICQSTRFGQVGFVLVVVRLSYTLWSVRFRPQRHSFLLCHWYWSLPRNDTKNNNKKPSPETGPSSRCAKPHRMSCVFRCVGASVWLMRHAMASFNAMRFFTSRHFISRLSLIIIQNGRSLSSTFLNDVRELTLWN